jgi:hypothetical protein
VFVSGKSPVKVHPEILDIFFLGELHIIYMDLGAHFSWCGECDTDRLRSVSFHSPFLSHFWIVARLVFSVCEAYLDHLAGILYS